MTDYRTELESLRDQVQQFNSYPEDVGPDNSSLPRSVKLPFWTSILTSKWLIYLSYLLIPIIVFVILFLVKPSIVMTENTENHLKGETKISWKYMAIWVISISLPVIIGIYIFMKKRKTI